jgi:hypothetical protein
VDHSVIQKKTVHGLLMEMRQHLARLEYEIWCGEYSNIFRSTLKMFEFIEKQLKKKCDLYERTVNINAQENFHRHQHFVNVVYLSHTNPTDVLIRDNLLKIMYNLNNCVSLLQFYTGVANSVAGLKASFKVLPHINGFFMKILRQMKEMH